MNMEIVQLVLKKMKITPLKLNLIIQQVKKVFGDGEQLNQMKEAMDRVGLSYVEGTH